MSNFATEGAKKAVTGGGKVGKIGQWMMKAVDKLGDVMKKIPGLGKLADKILGKFIPGIKKTC